MDTQQTSPTPPVNATGQSKSGRSWIWILVIIILAGIVYGLFYFKDKKEAVPLTKEEVVNSQAAQFEKELNDLPSDAPKEQRYNYMLRIARAEYQLGNHDKALLWLDQFPEEDKNYQGVWYTYAEISKARDDRTQALDYIKKAVVATPTNPQPWLSYFELVQDFSTAEQEAIYQEALRATDNDSVIESAYTNFQMHWK